MVTTIRGHSDVNGRVRGALIAMVLPQQIYKKRSATVWWMVHGIFLTRPPLGPTQPPIQGVPGLSRGESGRGVALTTHLDLAPS